MKKRLLYIALLLVVVSLFYASCERRSGRKDSQRQEVNTASRERRRAPTNTKGKTVIKMVEKGGVYTIPCKINGTSMEFIFDTGASDITISLTEAMFLYKQGTLRDEDFLGTQQYRIANGSVEEGTVINLSTVEIGNRTLHNVGASIVHNMEAPLLLGQSAFKKYGKISINYTRNEITFE